MKKPILQLFPLFLLVILLSSKSEILAQGLEKMDSISDMNKFVCNINSIPINICFIKDSNRFVGFIVAGHADKAVCQIASLEISNSLKKIGVSDSTLFSFGVAFDLRTNNWNLKYDSFLQSMKVNFVKLMNDNPFQVKVIEVSIQDYKRLENKIKKNNSLITEKLKSNKANKERVVISYNNIPFPIVIPFYDNDKIIQFKIDKNVLGEIPLYSMQRDLYDEVNLQIKELSSFIKTNETALVKISQANNKNKFYEFIFYSSDKGNIRQHYGSLEGYPPPPEYELTTTSQRINSSTGQIVDQKVSSKVISFEQAILFKDNPEIDIQIRNEIKRWIVKMNKYQLEFDKYKRMLSSKVRNSNFALKKEQAILRDYLKLAKTETTSDNRSNHIIDAFLRGWTFNTHDSTMNFALDYWYKEKRKIVWSTLLKDNKSFYNTFNPNLIDNMKNNIAGIFQSENIFFDVKDIDDKYLITPYQLMGGSFLQIIDKNKLQEFFTLNNFRNINN